MQTETPPQKTPKRKVRTAAKALIIRDEQILLLKCQKEKHVYYNLPGGGQDFGERIDQALVRECWEEAGATVRVQHLVFVRDYISLNHEFKENQADVHQIDLIFTCELLSPENPIGGPEPDDYQIGVEWISLDKLSEIRLYPGELAQYLPLPNNYSKEVYLGDVN